MSSRWFSRKGLLLVCVVLSAVFIAFLVYAGDQKQARTRDGNSAPPVSAPPANETFPTPQSSSTDTDDETPAPSITVSPTTDTDHNSASSSRFNRALTEYKEVYSAYIEKVQNGKLSQAMGMHELVNVDAALRNAVGIAFEETEEFDQVRNKFAENVVWKEIPTTLSMDGDRIGRPCVETKALTRGDSYYPIVLYRLMKTTPGEQFCIFQNAFAYYDVGNIGWLSADPYATVGWGADAVTATIVDDVVTLPRNDVSRGFNALIVEKVESPVPVLAVMLGPSGSWHLVYLYAFGYDAQSRSWCRINSMGWDHILKWEYDPDKGVSLFEGRSVLQGKGYVMEWEIKDQFDVSAFVENAVRRFVNRRQ